VRGWQFELKIDVSLHSSLFSFAISTFPIIICNKILLYLSTYYLLLFGSEALSNGDEKDVSMAADQEETRRQRKTRSDAGIPRLHDRDIQALRWIGEQGAANADHLRELLGRMSEYELDDPGKLSASRIRHIIEDHWLPAKVIDTDNILGKKWIWLTRSGLNRVELPFSPHRPADITCNHLAHINRIRLYLERVYTSHSLPFNWESAKLIERTKKEWKARKKADLGEYVPDEYRGWHMPDALWTFRNRGDTDDGKVFIEVEVSSKGLERTVDILLDLARHGTTWYFVEMDPKKGVYKTLMGALDKFTGRQEHYQGRFYLYDLADPNKLVYEYEKKSG
jgi:hypothetical protein